VQGIRDAVCDRGRGGRSDGCERRQVVGQPRQQPARDEAERDADHEAEPELPNEQDEQVVDAVAGLLDPGDEAELSKATAIGSFAPDSAFNSAASRRRSVVNRSVAKTAAASVEPTTAPEQQLVLDHERSR
jgi:hypothetical protein